MVIPVCVFLFPSFSSPARESSSSVGNTNLDSRLLARMTEGKPADNTNLDSRLLARMTDAESGGVWLPM